jgi:hypothetical protein
MNNLKRTAYKIVGYNGFTTIFIPTTKTVEEAHQNGKVGEQLWEQLADDGRLCGNMWTEREITGRGTAFEIPNPRDGYNQLITDFHNQLFEVEADLEKLQALDELTIHNQLHRSRLIGEKKALESVITKLKKQNV